MFNLLTNMSRKTRLALILAMGAVGWVMAMPALAATDGGEVMDWWTMGMTMLGGLALFL
ncbi:MAG: hypothetical protein GY731_17825, partial [Gammaproteobacteria bacterium]|nr:hypothetical protein [Gammaproteobacteria bacterium]